MQIDNALPGTTSSALEFKIAQRNLEYETLVQSLPLSIIRYDLDCKRIFLNAHWEKLNDFSAKEALGKTPSQLWIPYAIHMSGEEYEQRLRTVMETATAHIFEMQCLIDEQNVTYALQVVPEFDTEQTVVGALSIASDITQINHYKALIEHISYYDPLTNLPNRSLFYDRILFAIGRANRYQNQLGLFLVDLDRFNILNNAVGHEAGDQLLIEVSKRLVQAVRDYDTVARFGGDEFAILVTDIKNKEYLARVASKIKQALAAPFDLSGMEFFVTASVGIACYPHDTQNIDDLISYADTAMYQAKQNGRDRYQYYAQELTSSMIERMQLEKALRKALSNNEFSLHFQPCIDLSTDKITGAEALLRWYSPKLGPISPDKTIPIAEDLGLIVEIGAWVLMRAFEVAVILNKRSDHQFVIAVNLSARQFIGNDLVSTVKECLDITGCQANWVMLEITESMLIEDSNEIRIAFDALHQLGFGISIDDFGTGYSALAYLNKFPVSQMKIDRSFVRNILTDKNAEKLVNMIIAMADSLDKELVIEGIETLEQAQLLKSMVLNSDTLAQGYLYGKPMPAEQLLAML